MPKTYTLSELEKQAWDFAEEAHRGTFRKFSGVAYFDGHVKPVFKILKKVDIDEVAAAAALLHDVVEDVEGITNEDIVQTFGEEVGKLVFELTSIDELVKKMGKPEYLLDKMLTMSDKGLLIKLCDRCQNLSDHFNSSDEFRKNYYDQTHYIIEGLKRGRQLNKKHTTILNWIEGTMGNMKKRYSILEFSEFIMR